MRLAVTDKCNLRCSYCMPEHNAHFLPERELLSYEEMLRLCQILVRNGIEKIRITGGEPFVRKNLIPFLYQLTAIPGLKELALTTNGVLAAPAVPDLVKMGIRTVNLSLDTLDRDRFIKITKRDELPAVMHTLDQLLRRGIAVKINAVVMEQENVEDILPMVALTKELPVSVRFIEEMPFNGTGNNYAALEWDHVKILATIQNRYPGLEKLADPPYSTSYNYSIKGHKGNVGIIPAYTRSFCGTCNRIRITAKGQLKTCLYDGGVLDVKEIMRQGNDDAYLLQAITNAAGQRAENGWVAEQNVVHESMSSIGG